MQAKRILLSLIAIFSLFWGISEVVAARTLSVTINDGDRTTTDRNVDLTLVGPLDAESVRVSNSLSELDDANWREFKDVIRDWPFQGGSGTKTVYVRFKSRSGDESGVYRDSIKLELVDDGTREMTINDGDDETDSRTVRITITPPSDARRMRVANSVFLSEEKWRSVDDDFRWTLTEGDGEKTVYLQFQLDDGRISNIFNDSIDLDEKVSPRATFTINDGSRSTTNRRVKLGFERTQGYEKYRVSNSNSFVGSEWKNVPSQYSYWTILGTEGTNTVYIEFQDDDGDTKVISKSIKFELPVEVVGLKGNRLLRAENGNTLYYLGTDAALHPFTSLASYHSFYPNFREVSIVSEADLAKFPIGTSVCIKQGTWLVQFSGFNRVYAVEPGCTLRPIRSEVEATLMYGREWQTNIVVLPFSNRSKYTIRDLSNLFVEDDLDRDGLSDARERELGTSVSLSDTDRDGLTDFEEVEHLKTDPTSADTDADGVSDAREILLGVSPKGDGTFSLQGTMYEYPLGTVIYDRWNSRRYYYHQGDGLFKGISRNPSERAFAQNYFQQQFVAHPLYNFDFESSSRGVRSNDAILKYPLTRLGSSITQL